jgi:hypothetical protein
MENGIIPMIVFVLGGVTWALTTYQCHRLRRKFIAKYPAIASQEIPYAFSHTAHPEKAIFFLRQRAADLLKGDEELWKERRKYVALFSASLILFCLGFAIIFYGMYYALFNKFGP